MQFQWKYCLIRSEYYTYELSCACQNDVCVFECCSIAFGVLSIWLVNTTKHMRLVKETRAHNHYQYTHTTCLFTIFRIHIKHLRYKENETIFFIESDQNRAEIVKCNCCNWYFAWQKLHWLRWDISPAFITLLSIASVTVLSQNLIQYFCCALLFVLRCPLFCSIFNIIFVVHDEQFFVHLSRW